MRFIGQHIFDFIARFRDDIYLEDLTESAQDHVVGIDADGKLYKQDVSTGDITGVTITTDSGGGSAASDTGGSADFSILGSSGVDVTNSGTTITAVAVPAEIDHDSLSNFVAAEHVDWASASAGTIHSTNIPTLNQNTTGQAGTVATITGLAPDTATTQATQPNITTMTGFVTGSANQLLTDDGDGTVTSEAGLTWDGDALDVTSSTSGKPEVTFTNTNSNPKGPSLFFIKDKGAAGALNDEAGSIFFKGDNASQSLKNYGSIAVKAIGVISGDESGTLVLSTASSNGTTSNLRNIITGTGSTTGDTVTVDIAYGTGSATTIAGTLRINGDSLIAAGNLTLIPGGTLELDSTGDMTLDSSANIELNADGGDIDFKDGSAQLAKISSAGLSFVDNTGAGIIFEGDTDDAYNTTLIAVDTTSSNKTVRLPDASGTVALTNTHISIIRSTFFANSTSGYYITLGGGSTGESSSLAQSSYTTVFNCPFDGQVKRIAASTQTTTSKTVKLEMYINKDDSDLVADQRGSDWNVSSYTSSWCEDSPGDWTFSKGENIAIRATDSEVVYGTQYSIVLEFDLTT